MPKTAQASEQVIILPHIIKWSLIASVVGLLAGTASAFFLISLDLATRWRESHLWIIALLPLGGLLTGLLYHTWGRSTEGGHNLILDEIHDPQSTVPLRMAPLVLLTTIITHFFGGSAGREGTAVQMGSSLADQLTKPLRLSSGDRRTLLMAGMSAGFASIFGTPLAGAVFGLEVLAIGRLRYDAIFPCFIAATLGHYTTLAWGVHHTAYHIPSIPGFTLSGLMFTIIAGAFFGIVGTLFSKVTHEVNRIFKKYVSYAPLRPLIGGLLIATAVWAIGTTRYIGLGIPTIVDSFSIKLPPWDFMAKLAFTTVTLGAGFKGGEVTPLFFIGATLGNALAAFLGLPYPLLAGMGFVAVFAGAANTPLASTLMAMEIFGSEVGGYAGVACVVSYLFSGHAGIYGAQRIGSSKHVRLVAEEGQILSDLVKLRRRPSVHVDFFQDVHFLGFLNRKENQIMSDLIALRVYFNYDAKVKKKGFWSKLSSPSLGSFLTAQAKEYGIEQAVLHRVSLGFLKDQPLSQDFSEMPPPKLPQCLELLGTESTLRKFVLSQQEHLQNARLVFLRCESPLFDSAQDKIEDLVQEEIPLGRAAGR